MPLTCLEMLGFPGGFAGAVTGVEGAASARARDAARARRSAACDGTENSGNAIRRAGETSAVCTRASAVERPLGMCYLFAFQTTSGHTTER